MTPANVVPMDLAERARGKMVRSLRDLADQLERAPRDQLPDLLVRLPFAEVDQAIKFLRHLGRSRSMRT